MQLALLLLILIINTAVALIYLIWGVIRRKDKEKDRGHFAKYALLSFVILICPLIGPLFLCVSQLLYLLFSRRDVDMSDVSFNREKMESYTQADVDRDINIAPMQESLMVSDVKRRRKLLLDVLKKDIRRSLGSIAIALNNPDSETSHYAASVIMDVLSEFRGNVQNMFVKLKADPEDFDLGALLLDYIHEVVRQEVLTGEEKRSYVYMEDEIGDMMYRHAPERIEGWQYKRLMDDLVSAEDYPLAEKWSRRALKYRDYQLDTYMGCMKLYYTYGDRDQFLQCLRQLKSSGIVVDKTTMELIRMFDT